MCAGVRTGVIGARFHHAVADVVVDLAAANTACRAPLPCPEVFQNARCCGWSYPDCGPRDST
jgi:hypothetical protein